jgi:protein-tyrosine phosphatase
VHRHIEFARLHNFRDLGGYPAADGRHVAWQRLYRSDSLGSLRDKDWDIFAALGVHTVIDLRHEWEITKKGRVPAYDGLSYHHLPIEHRPFDQVSLGPEVDPAEFLALRYAEVAADGVRELAQVLRALVDGEYPVVFHCASGKDRTGVVAALTLTLLGVPEDVVVADFALTERARDRLVGDWLAEHPGRNPTWPAFGRTPPEIMRNFLRDLDETYGSVAGYCRQHLAVDDGLIAALRTRYLEYPDPDSPE